MKILYESDNSVVNDEIFLLSDDEYNKYKNVIPGIGRSWWLRSPDGDSYSAAYVNSDGNVNRVGTHVSYPYYNVRPALKISNLESSNLQIGDHFDLYNNTWVLIDDGLAISLLPIGMEKFDDESNNYKNSYIRQWLLQWLDKQKAKEKQFQRARENESLEFKRTLQDLIEDGIEKIGVTAVVKIAKELLNL